MRLALSLRIFPLFLYWLDSLSRYDFLPYLFQEI